MTISSASVHGGHFFCGGASTCSISSSALRAPGEFSGAAATKNADDTGNNAMNIDDVAAVKNSIDDIDRGDKEDDEYNNYASSAGVPTEEVEAPMDGAEVAAASPENEAS